MRPVDRNGDDLQHTDEATEPWAWLAFWWCWAAGEIEAPACVAVVRRHAARKLADLTCNMGW